MNQQYLIPANTKKSQLIFNTFRPIDLGIFGFGAFTTLILLFVFTGDSLQEIVLKLLPVLISGFLVVPIPHYHNVLVFLTDFYLFLTNRRVYLWKGWCASVTEKDE